MVGNNTKTKKENKLIGKTVYEDFAIRKAMNENLRHIATAILASAIEDADVEFLTNDYEEWKVWRKKRMKKSEFYTELEFKQEFNYKQDYKETLFDICEKWIGVEDIPQEILKQRKLFEETKMQKLSKITNYQFDTLNNIAKLHGWKIGCNYVEPTLFDDDF